MYWVYVLKNQQGRYYTGYTHDLIARIKNHNQGKSYWTSRSNCWQLIYSEVFLSKTEAIRREKVLKTGRGRDELKRKNIL